MKIQNIGFIGLGNMGLPMARNLIRAGFSVTVYDVVSAKIATLVQEGAKAASCIKEVITPGCIIISMLPNDQALLDVVNGEQGIAKHMDESHVHISMSTVSPSAIQQISCSHKKYQTAFIAAPVFGRPESIPLKQLWIFLSGEKKIKEKFNFILREFSQGIYDFGEKITSSNEIKLAANFLVLSAISAMGEAFDFIEGHGLDKTSFANMLTETLFACPAYRYHAHKIAEKIFRPAGFSLNLGIKDIRLLMENARSAGITMPTAELLHDKLVSSLARGYGDLDWRTVVLHDRVE